MNWPLLVLIISFFACLALSQIAEAQLGSVDDVEITIVNKTVTAFKWDDEVKFSFRPVGLSEGYDYEWERNLNMVKETIIISEKPTSNIINYEIETKGLDFFYQPALTQKEIDRGVTRLGDVVGSYAVYHNGKASNRYMTGKAFHIYRPYAVDDDGAFTWLELIIDVKGQQMHIVIPQDYIDSAKFPIMIDPTFGITTVGGSEDYWADRVICQNATISEDGTLDHVTAYIKQYSDNTPQIRGGVYKVTDNTQVGNSSWWQMPAAQDAWQNFSQVAGSLELTSGAEYWLCVVNDVDIFRYKFDTVTGDGANDLGENDLPSILNPATSDQRASIFANYTAAAADETPPDLNFGTDTLANNSYTDNSSSIFVAVNGTEALSACLLDNTTVNQSMTVSGNDCYFDWTGLANNSVHYFFVYGNDTAGNLNVTEHREITINLTSYPCTPSWENTTWELGINYSYSYSNGTCNSSSLLDYQMWNWTQENSTEMWDTNECAGSTNTTYYDNISWGNYTYNVACCYEILANITWSYEGNTTPDITNGTCNSSSLLDYQMWNWTEWNWTVEWDTNVCGTANVTHYDNTSWGNYTYNVACAYAVAPTKTACDVEPILITNQDNEEIEIGWGFDCRQILEGLFLGDMIYGEMWNFSANATAWTFDIDAANTYYNLTNLTQADRLNGFTATQAVQVAGGSYLTASVAGLYKISFSLSFEASLNNALYGIGIAQNFDITLNRNCYARRWATKNQAGNVADSCFMYLAAGDTVNMQIENEDTNRDIKVHTANFNVIRIAD